MSRTFNHAILKIKNTDGKYDALSALRGQSSYELAVEAGFAGSEKEWMESIIGDGWIGAFQELEAKVIALENSTKLVYSNIAVSNEDFVPDSTYEYYPYRASIPIEECTTNMTADVFFASEDVFSGVFSPVTDTYDGGVYIYSWRAPDEPINIPTIWLWR